MKHWKFITSCLLLEIIISTSLVAQRNLTVDDISKWKRISESRISNDGKWIAAKIEPWVGDAMIRLYNAKGEETATITPVSSFEFSNSSTYLLATITPGMAITDSLKIKKTKDDKMPMNSLFIKSVTGKEETIDSLRNYKLAAEANWIAYQTGRKDSTLYIRSLEGNSMHQFPGVSEYGFAEKSGTIYYVTSGDSSSIKAGLYVFDPVKQISGLIKDGEGIFKQLAFNKTGDKLAFLYCDDKDSVYKNSTLWLSINNSDAHMIADRSHKALPSDWVISEHGAISFSKNGSRLFFGTSPEPQRKDTTILAEHRPNVQVWSWDEPVQYTVQQFNKEKDLKQSYAAVYNINEQTLFQLATPEIPQIQLGDEGEASLALLSDSRPYSLSSMWEGRTRSDYYTISLTSGERRLVRKGDYGRLRLSPKGQYAYWYGETDSCCYTLELSGGKLYKLTTPDTFAAWDAENDVPDYPRAYGAAGWTADDKSLLIYDRYDIWQFDPRGTTPPVNLTVNGRKEQIRYRFITLDSEKKHIETGKAQMLSGFNETTKGYGYYQSRLNKPATPKALLAGNFMLRTPIKAKQSDAIIYTRETFEEYPEIYLSDLSFKRSKQLTSEGKQQEGILWGTAELTSWTSLDGQQLDGVIYKPANFDPNKKYPLIVNFYERNAETLYNYRMPEPHRSTIDYHLYNSNDYIIFNPDIRYKDGYPGESSYNAVMPGIASLIERGYINEKAIGAQGHSWGGYQVAYLATRTNLFAAIESGAPVVNMFSAYGGIRWSTGLNRSFQYEHGQSRIGDTLWNVPGLYKENSPLFTMDKVETPILIMHNDADGHVPWYQGIEYFVSLKRLQKPVWMLNYTGEPHWPMKMANRIDFQKRMMQFFNHYLKAEPMPQWMKEGVPAVKEPFELGY